MIYPDPAPVAIRPPTTVDSDAWEMVVERLMAWRNQETLCQTVPFSEQATDLFAKWRHQLITNERRVDSNCGWTGKLPGHLVRIALCLAVLDAAASGSEPPEIIEVDHVKRAGKYVDYLAANRRRIRLESGAQPVERLVREFARFVVEHQTLNLDAFELRRGVIAGVRSEATLRAVLAELESAGWLAPTLGPIRRDMPIPATIRIHPAVAQFWTPEGRTN